MKNKHDKVFQLHREMPEPPRKMFRLRYSSLFETFAFLTVCVLLDYFFGAGDRWVGMQLHPFWIVVLVMAVNYGTLEGIVAAFLATVFLYAWNVPPQTVEETPFEYQVRLSTVPLLWFISAFVLGEIRARLSYDKYTLELKAYEEGVHADKIAKRYEEQRATRELLESHIAAEKATVSKVYEVLKTIERNSPASLLQSIEPVIRFAVDAKKFSVFELGPKGMEVITAFGWEGGEPYLRRIPSEHPIYLSLLEKRELLSVINEEDQKVLRDQGILAAPLCNPETNEIFGMVKIEDICVKQLNVSTVKTFKMSCQLIGSAYANAIEYKKLQEMRIFDAKYNVFSSYLFEVEQKKIARHGIPCTLINLSFPTLNTRRDEEKIHAVIARLTEVLLDGFEMYLGGRSRLIIHILLPLMRKKQVQQIHQQLIDLFADDSLFKERTPEIEIEVLPEKSPPLTRALDRLFDGS